MPAAGLEICLEMRRLLHRLKSKIRLDFPRAALGCMGDTTTIVLGKTILQISCAADVTLIGTNKTPQDVSVKHWASSNL